MKKERWVCEVRALEENDEMVIEGYAVVFNTPATHGFTEIINENAFNNADMRDVCLKYNHDDSYLILARTRNNSLLLNVDDKGLKIRAKLIDTQQNKDIYKMVKEGLLDKMSFGFTVNNESWDYETDTRTVLGIEKLYDVSIVTTPFYDTTEVYARSQEEFEKEKEQYNKLKLEKAKLKLKLDINSK